MESTKKIFLLLSTSFPVILVGVTVVYTFLDRTLSKQLYIRGRGNISLGD